MPWRLSRTTSSKASRGTSNTGRSSLRARSTWPPAAFTRMSTRPRERSSSSRAAPTCASSSTSATRASASPPRRRISSAFCSARIPPPVEDRHDGALGGQPAGHGAAERPAPARHHRDATGQRKRIVAHAGSVRRAVHAPAPRPATCNSVIIARAAEGASLSSAARRRGNPRGGPRRLARARRGRGGRREPWVSLAGFRWIGLSLAPSFTLRAELATDGSHAARALGGRAARGSGRERPPRARRAPRSSSPCGRRPGCASSRSSCSRSPGSASRRCSSPGRPSGRGPVADLYARLGEAAGRPLAGRPPGAAGAGRLGGRGREPDGRGGKDLDAGGRAAVQAASVAGARRLSGCWRSGRLEPRHAVGRRRDGWRSGSSSPCPLYMSSCPRDRTTKRFGGAVRL